MRISPYLWFVACYFVGINAQNNDPTPNAQCTSFGQVSSFEDIVVGAVEFFKDVVPESLNCSDSNIDGGITITNQTVLRDFLPKLVTLQTIDFSDNTLEQPLPPDFCRIFPNLRILRLNENQIQNPRTGIIDLDRCPELLFLDLSDNEFSGNTIARLNFLQNLQVLSVANNRITTFPQVSLPELRFLEISQNIIGSFFTPDFGERFPKLESLGTFDNRIAQEIPASLFSAPVQRVSLGVNDLSGSIPSEIVNAKDTLTLLFLQNNSLSGDLPDEIYELTNLEVLDLRGNKFTGQISPRIAELTNLRTLLLGGNEFEGEMPDHNVLDTDTPSGTVFPNEIRTEAPTVEPDEAEDNVAVIVGASIGVLVVVGIAGFVVFRRRKAHYQNAEIDMMLKHVHRPPSGMRLDIDQEAVLDNTRYNRNDQTFSIRTQATHTVTVAEKMSPRQNDFHGVRDSAATFTVSQSPRQGGMTTVFPVGLPNRTSVVSAFPDDGSADPVRKKKRKRKKKKRDNGENNEASISV